MNPAGVDGGGTFRPIVRALRGALGFLTRLPVGRAEEDWLAFTTTPAAFPVIGYVVGILAVLPVGLLTMAGTPTPVMAAAYLITIYLITGIHHVDGLADLSDAAAVHGDPETRRAVLRDTTVGVGGTLAVAVLVGALALGTLAVTSFPIVTAVGLLVVGEVSAKLGMAAVACFGKPGHEGMGSRFAESLGPSQFLGPVVAALPAAFLTLPSPAGLAALAGGVGAALTVARWATHRLGGVNGDVFGAANELGRLVALHIGVVVWTVM